MVFETICIIGGIIAIILFIYGLRYKKEGFAVYSIPVAVALIVTETTRNALIGVAIAVVAVLILEKICNAFWRHRK